MEVRMFSGVGSIVVNVLLSSKFVAIAQESQGKESQHTKYARNNS
jgi:hypothetical protein